MKKIIILLLIPFYGFSTNYYFSSVSGDDSRSSATAQNPATPWATVTKLNSFFSSLNAGDSALFKRGETFTGSFIINKSGSSGNWINIGAYGVGNNPIITSLFSVSSWTNIGTNLWESLSSVSTFSSLKCVVINGIMTPMGRYPNQDSKVMSPRGIHLVPGNNGWLNYDSHSGTTQITDNYLPASPNWTGAKVVIKTANWVVDIGQITSHATHIINYSPTAIDGGGYSEPIDGQSYFIEDDIRTLDETNEWYYNPSTKKLTVYSISSPVNLQVSTTQNLINGNSKNYISLSNLDLLGSNSDLILLQNNITGWKISNCTIRYSGRDGIFSNTLDHCTVQYCNIQDCNNNGVMFRDQADNNSFIGNNVSNIGIYAGMTDQSLYFSCEGLHCVGDNFTATSNSVSHVGIDGIRFGGSNVLVNKNFVTDHCIVKTDAGGLYTWGVNGDVTYTNQIIEDNTIINGSDLGVIGTVLEQEELSVNGIYLDGESQNVIVRRNNISHVDASGIYMNTPINCTIRDNNIFDCRYAAIHTNNGNGSTLNLSVKHNICVAKLLNTQPTGSNQRCFYYLSINNDITSCLVSDSNYYTRPIDDVTANPLSKVVYSGSYSGPGEPAVQIKYTLAAWKSAFGTLDQHSNKSAIVAGSYNDFRFEYNETSSNKTIFFPNISYTDVTGVTYTNSLTLLPYTSVTLIKRTVVLPTKIKWLKSTADGKNFQWESAEEDNIVYWAIEESTDGINWKQIYKTPAKGVSIYNCSR